MELIAALPLVGPLLATVLPFLLVLGVVVFVHEFGHYIVGRWCGIGAEVFSIGFGRELFGWTDRRGTRWRVAALPLGGYVKFTGDADASSSHADPATLARLSPEERGRSFHLASVERRALTVFAGPAANFLLSIVIFAMMALGQGRPADGPVIGEISADVNPEFAQALRPGDRVTSVNGREVADFAALQAALLETEGAEAQATVVRDGTAQTLTISFRPPARVDGLAPGGAAEAAGLQVGDVIVGVDGREIGGFSDLQRATQDSGGQPMTLTVLRDGATFETAITPQMGQATDPVTGATVPRPLLGVQKFSREIMPLVEPVGPASAVGFGVQRTWDVIALSLSGLADVISGREEAREVLGGPIRIAEVSGDAAASGVAVFIGLIAVLSTSIGLINLFPIPILDGGHLMFYAIEKLRGRPLRERWQEIGNGVGLALVLSLMIFATFNDLSRF
ncbi:MAG: RIP metalloprotease RseP [Rubrimonas sp.]